MNRCTSLQFSQISLQFSQISLSIPNGTIARCPILPLPFLPLHSPSLHSAGVAYHFQTFYNSWPSIIMEELLGLHEEQGHSRPDRELGESWQEINCRMKRALMEGGEGIHGRTKLFSEATNKSSLSQSRKVTFSKVGAEKQGGSREVLKLVRTATEQENIESQPKSLSKRTNTEPYLKQSIQQRTKMGQIKLNSKSMLNSKAQPVKSLQDKLKQPPSARRMLQLRQNNLDYPIESPIIPVKQDAFPNRMAKSRPEALHSQRGTFLPTKVDILIANEMETPIRKVKRVSQSLVLRRSVHLQQSVHSRGSSKDALPYISQGHQDRRKQDTIQSNSIRHYPRSLSKDHQLQDCKKTHERELQARLRRELLQLGKNGKLLANIRPIRLKLTK